MFVSLTQYQLEVETPVISHIHLFQVTPTTRKGMKRFILLLFEFPWHRFTHNTTQVAKFLYFFLSPRFPIAWVVVYLLAALFWSIVFCCSWSLVEDKKATSSAKSRSSSKDVRVHLMRLSCCLLSCTLPSQWLLRIAWVTVCSLGSPHC